MKKINCTVVVLLIVCGIVSCKNKNAPLNYLQNTTRIQSQVLPVDSLIGKPYDMVCRDSLLIYYDRYERKFLSVFDFRKNKFIGRFVSEGNGPGEAIAPLYLLSFPEKDKIYGYQRNSATLSLFDIPEFRIERNITFSASGAWRPFEVQKMKDYYLGISIFDKGRFGIYDQEGQLLQTGGKYPFGGEKMDRTQAFMLYQGPFCANPGSNHFASASSYGNYLSFYEIRDNEIVLLKEYASQDVGATYSGQLMIKDECVIHFTNANGTENHCYMLYSGKTYAENEGGTDGGRHIVIFDWQGNYLRTLETDCEIRNFYVDEANQLIFAVARSREGGFELVKFQL